MTRRYRTVLALAVALGTTAAGLGCGGSSPQTGIVAEVTSDLLVPGELDDVRVVITSSAGQTLYEQSFPLAAGAGAKTYALPLRVGVQPQASAAAPFRIEAIGRLAGANVVSRSATLTFVNGRVLLLPLPLLAVCRQVICSPAAETCRENGTCAPDGVDPTGLPPYSPGSDAGPPPDARDGGTGGRGGTTGAAGSGGVGVGGGSAGSGGAGGSSGGASAGSGGASTGSGGASAGSGGASAGSGGASAGTGGRGGAGGSSGGASAGSGGAGGAGGRGGAAGASAGSGGASAGSGGSGGTGGAGGRGGGGGGDVVPSLNDGLVGYSAFDQAGLMFPDYSGNANTMRLPTATNWTTAGHVGGALDLLNTTDFGGGVQSTASVNTITSSITIAGWIIPQGGALRTIVSRVINTGYWKLSLADTGAVRFTAGPMVAQAPNAAGDGSQWVHVAATYDGAGVRLYVGGALVAQAVFGAVSLVGGPAGGPGGFGIDVGGIFDNINATIIENYRGRLDELTIYNRALTQGEVDALARGVLPVRR